MNVMKYKKYYLLFSVLVLIPGVLSLLLNGLALSIDFTGGSVFEFGFEKDMQSEADAVSDLFVQKSVHVNEVSVIGDNTVSITTDAVDAQTGAEIKTALGENYGQVTQKVFETVGASVGKETTKNAFLALALASLGIVLYIAYAFRNIGVRVGALFITALLTVIGFSVHDSIVVFDRIRENLLGKMAKTTSFSDAVNYSLVETLNRSFATSLTVLLVLTSLLVLGGESMKEFVLALVIGIASGTYSSIFVAAPILIFWETRKNL
ncbi:MAG: Protein translocase subunit SecF [candidate division WWE3 bacterium GW2011_GWC1_47_10]|uniref:Protein-export membrane protein SecF n=1 Tax=candidate division WWE3 bacterium GW2011_GWC1_47_10 TaxID=1619122 RepID=A0A0G1T9L5_UNCKA|nr:MAG: Protein translocase subunit SecF [candidate division WWE3 bacterium GW2011_GWC1_47_10]